MGRLAGKVAIITGSCIGIGRAIALLFAREGAKTVVNCRTGETGEETVKKIRDAKGEATYIEADVSKAQNIEKMVKTTINTYGGLDILVNNAVYLHELAFTADLTIEEWEKTIATNLTGSWLCMKYAIPEMIKRGGGSIINIASQAATRGNAGLTAYTASKGGLLSLSRNTAVEYADKNIRVNVLEPGYAATPLITTLMKNPEISRKIIEGTPQHRLGELEEIAYAALFLASDESSHVTGAELAVDGGIAAWSHTI